MAKGKCLPLCSWPRSERTSTIRSILYLGNIILRRGLFLCNTSSSPQSWSECQALACLQSWMNLKLIRSIPYNRNVNCSIDFLLCLYCLFNCIFLAGNFLIKNPVIGKPHKLTDTSETTGNAEIKSLLVSLSPTFTAPGEHSKLKALPLPTESKCVWPSVPQRLTYSD